MSKNISEFNAIQTRSGTTINQIQTRSGTILWCASYTLSLSSKPTGVDTITCYRYSSNQPGASTGSSATLTNGSTVYYGDVIYISATASSGYKAPSTSSSTGTITNNNLTVDSNESITVTAGEPDVVELSFYNNSSYSIALSGGITTTIAAGNTYSSTVPYGTSVNTINFNCSDIEATSASVTPGVLTSNYAKTITVGSTTTPTGLTGSYSRTISGTQSTSSLWKAVNWTFLIRDNEIYQVGSATLTDSGSTLQGYRSAGEPEQNGNRVTVHWEINTKTKVGRRAYNFVVKIKTDKYATTYFVDVSN